MTLDKKILTVFCCNNRGLQHWQLFLCFMSMMNEKFEEKQKNSSNKNGANGVTFNAYDSEITISQRDSAKINNAFSINSPLTSLRSLSWRSTSRSLSGIIVYIYLFIC